MNQPRFPRFGRPAALVTLPAMSALAWLAPLCLMLVCLAPAAPGCGKSGSEAKGANWPDPPMPDGSTVLRKGMTVEEMRQALGGEGVTRPAPENAAYKEGVEFTGTPKYPDAHVFVALSSDGKVAGWTLLRPMPHSATAPAHTP